MVTTRKSNRLDINLNQVKDIPTREALNGIVRFVTDLMSIGVEVDGSMSAKDIAIKSKGFLVDQDGNLTAKTFASVGGDLGGPDYDPIKAFKTKAFSGSIAASSSISIHINGSVIGVCGWTQNFGADWHPMHETGAVAGSIYVAASSPSAYNKVKLTNADGVNTNSFKLMVFYTD